MLDILDLRYAEYQASLAVIGNRGAIEQPAFDTIFAFLNQEE